MSGGAYSGWRPLIRIGHRNELPLGYGAPSSNVTSCVLPLLHFAFKCRTAIVGSVGIRLQHPIPSPFVKPVQTVTRKERIIRRSGDLRYADFQSALLWLAGRIRVV